MPVQAVEKRPDPKPVQRLNRLYDALNSCGIGAAPATSSEPMDAEEVVPFTYSSPIAVDDSDDSGHEG